jgi:integrase
LRRSNLRLPEPTRNDDGELQYGWGELVFERSAPATGAAWTDSGTRREARQLKGSEVGERRVAPSPPELTRLLTRHPTEHGTDDEGRLFRGVQTGGEVPEGTYCRIRKKAREAALSPEECASPLAARPYDLRHACVSTWLNAGVPGPRVAEWAGHGLDVPYRIYAKCLAGQQDTIRLRIDRVLSTTVDGR